MDTRLPEEAKPGALASTHKSITARRFQGTDNPRHLRALHELLRGPVPRKTLDRRVGCANGPALIDDLRARGLEIPCPRVKAIDRDGKTCWPGVYHLTARDRRMVCAWLAGRVRA